MKYKERIINSLVIIFGNILLALGICLFILPFNIDNGGLSGISVILKDYINPAVLITVLNWVLFFAGFLFLKKEFAIKTLLSAIIYPLAVNVLYNSDFSYVISNELKDPFLATVLGSILVGAGLGLVYRVGGSTGGLDVISVILNRCEPTSTWSSYYNDGTNPIVQITARGQFEVYSNGSYKKYLPGGALYEKEKRILASEVVKDALNGVRNNDYLGFNAWFNTSYSNNYVAEGGNRFR